MSGKYVYLVDDMPGENPYGVTHGCGCCSKRESLTQENLVDHIEQLTNALYDAKRILSQHFPETE